jgi:hypothetical protein
VGFAPFSIVFIRQSFKYEVRSKFLKEEEEERKKVAASPRALLRYYISGEQVQTEDVVMYKDEFAIVKSAFSAKQIKIHLFVLRGS